MYTKTNIIFDLDDTLIDTSDLFYQSREKFLNLFLTDNDINEVRNQFELFDTINFKKFGYSPERYFQSMKDTYIHYFSSQQFKSKKETIKICHSLLFNAPSIIGDTYKTLKDLKATGFTLLLITRGIYSFQMHKLNCTNLIGYFNKIDIVPDKSADVLSDILNKYNLTIKNSIKVGDSMKSDIIPSQNIGLDCVKFNYKHPKYTWIQDASKCSGEVKSIENLNELISLIKYGS